jgi:hypothetical protein
MSFAGKVALTLQHKHHTNTPTHTHTLTPCRKHRTLSRSGRPRVTFTDHNRFLAHRRQGAQCVGVPALWCRSLSSLIEFVPIVDTLVIMQP